jgi:gluconate kinase
MKTVIIIVGQMGCGKTYWGKLVAKQANHEFFDGDDVLTSAMREKVSHFRPLTKAMVDDYVRNHLAPAIVQRAGDDYLVVAQALYRKEHRDFLEKYLKENGCCVHYWYLWTPFWRNLKQLWSRPKGFRWVLYWLMNRPFFQEEGL